METIENGSRSEKRYWWLSFATDTEFLGVAIVEAPDPLLAVAKTHRLKINPGGEVAGSEIHGEKIPDKYHNRLLSREELQEAGLA